MNDHDLLALMVRVDPMTRRVPEGIREIAKDIEAAERERWTAEATKMADEWDEGRPLDGTVSTALRELVRRVCVA